MGKVPEELSLAIPAVDAEVEALRARTESLVAELERRLRGRAQQVQKTLAGVKRLTDVRAQFAAHPGLFIGLSSAAAIALGYGVYVAVARWRERQKPLPRLKARLQGYRALFAQPHRAFRAREPIGKRLFAALLIAGATTIVRSLSTLLVKRTVEPRMLPPARR